MTIRKKREMVMTRLEEVMQRIGARPALIRLANAGDFFGENAPYRIEDAVAIIDIVGPLSNAAWSWRGTTYGEIQDQLKIASADPNVRGILLNINSPGGETDNAFETADMIAALEKPCYAVAATSAYSAAYLLASQADRIYCSPKSGGVGSIGVYWIHMDLSEAMKQAGIKPTIISAGEGKADANPYEPLSDSARADLKAWIDYLYGHFVASVSEGRDMSAAEVVKLGAKCFDGADASIAAGLADAPGDLSTAWVDMCNDIQRPSIQPMGARSSAATAAGKEPVMAEQQAAEGKVPTAAEIEAMVTEARDKGFGAAAEIVDLCALAGEPGMAAEFITGRKSVADVRVALLAKKVEKEKASTQGKELITGITPGADAGGQVQAKASPWRNVLGSLGARLKEVVS
jgi:signal peptide peptidase SppA